MMKKTERIKQLEQALRDVVEIIEYQKPGVLFYPSRNIHDARDSVGFKRAKKLLNIGPENH